MSEELETVLEHCTHPDCIYRGAIDAGYTPVCLYAMHTGEARRCPISECDKYKPGKKIKARIRREDIVIFWETEDYEDADDNILGR